MSCQLALPLEPCVEPEFPLRRAWARARLRVSYDAAIRVPALAICLRNIAAAESRPRHPRPVAPRNAPRNGGRIGRIPVLELESAAPLGLPVMRRRACSARRIPVAGPLDFLVR